MYSRRGDKGETDTPSGRRVTKDNPVIEWEGTLDELISHIGYSNVQLGWDDMRDDLSQVQMDLFHLGEEILTSGKGRRLREEGVSWIEGRTAAYLREVGEVKLFVVPGGSREAATLQLSRAVTRRAERRLVELNAMEKVNPLSLQYLNRLSSLIFMMALAANKRLKFEETLFPWPNPDRKSK
ncbi:MAG: cob(I)yrinic acid a,c-diamide adenosyltransferase [Candidatus Thermoplasmatota archaeon]|nr:cob(I)yrinic acid a,c-diamide adenosyltransferase [Candidatus Thermoplasmatota archaeon]MCL5789259.1 cob(I)yrinic acid a,c-diamide adenosyltransferase [Candidatus Thermoplasmatota archaeon]